MTWEDDDIQKLKHKNRTFFMGLQLYDINS